MNLAQRNGREPPSGRSAVDNGAPAVNRPRLDVEPAELPRRPPHQPWWVNYFDPESIKNPWHELEVKYGLSPRGSW